MANYKHLIGFIKKWEGGLSKDTADSASKNPLPDNSGYHTNKGLTWLVWKGVFGDSADSIKRFYEMNDLDWGIVFKTLYWDKISGDKINSQRCADIMVDFCWASGLHYPILNLQGVLNGLGAKLTVDGSIGQMTVNAMNNANENDLWAKMCEMRFNYIDMVIKHNPQDIKFKTGWLNRVNSLIMFENNATA